MAGEMVRMCNCSRANFSTRKGVAWPSMAPADSACQRHVMINGNVYRTVPDASWDGARRADDMARTGVSHQVVSPMPELLSYWLNVDDEGGKIRVSLLAHRNEICVDVTIDGMESSDYMTARKVAELLMKGLVDSREK